MTSPSPSIDASVVVITGASSGIGRAAAHAFARRRARLVLAARRNDALRDAAEECASLGAPAIALPTDITDPVEVQWLAEAAVEAFGRIDVWINNAGVGVFGPFTNATVDAHRRVVETNLFGTMYGAAAVIPIFLRQNRGIMITNVSVGGFVPTPFAAAYTASKFGLRGFMASLRAELAPHRHIHLCSLFPAMVDTPGFRHGANVSGHALEPPRAPLLAPQKVAEAMVDLVKHPRAEVAVGWPTRPAQLGYALAPRLTERVAGAVLRRVAEKGPPTPRTSGNLFVPVHTGTSPTGGLRRRPYRKWPGRQRLALAGIATATATAAMLITRHRDRKG